MREFLTPDTLPVAMTVAAEQPKKDPYQEAADRAAENEDLNHQNPAMTQLPAPDDRIPPRRSDFVGLPSVARSTLLEAGPDEDERQRLERDGKRENDEEQERRGERSDFAHHPESRWQQKAMTFLSRLGSLGLRPNLT